MQAALLAIALVRASAATRTATAVRAPAPTTPVRLHQRVFLRRSRLCVNDAAAEGLAPSWLWCLF